MYTLQLGIQCLFMKYRERKCESNRIASVRGKSGVCYCLLNCTSRLCIYLIIVDLKYNDISGSLLYSGYSDYNIGYCGGCVAWGIGMHCCCSGYRVCGIGLNGR